MRNRKNDLSVLVVFFLLFTLSFGGITVHAENAGFSFKILPALQELEISTDKINLKSDLVFPDVLNSDVRLDKWRHVSRTTTEKQLAGEQGQCLIDIFQSDGLRLTREFWHSEDKDEIALRQKVTNLNSKPIQLKFLLPLKLNSLVFKEEKRADNWNVLIQKRLKNGKPVSIVPSDNKPVEADPFCVFHANKKNTPDLLIGYLSQTGHLARLLLQFNNTGQQTDFFSLAAECQFDGVLIPQGGERTSQWVYIKAGFDANELIAEYADKVGEYHGVKRPTEHAPSVFCTWYFHGRHYNENYFMDDIQSLRENRVPFDVFLIDDCWANGNWGYWNTNHEAFPGGMKQVTDTMRKNGYRPGIWTAPYSVDMDSDLAREHPEWLLKTTADTLVVFGYAVKAWILDPTYPGVCDHLEKVYRRLANDYGFSYFKFDFMRSVFIYDNAKFYDPHVTRLEAYRMGLEAIRKGVGPDAYISVCGGHFGGSLGLADSQRSGSDVVSIWRPLQIECFRQNILRTWMSRLWHVDPDALMLRKRATSYHDPEDTHSHLSLGTLTDKEALTFTLNQYVGGGMVCFSEYMKELQPDRRDMYRHAIPSIYTPSEPLDIYNTFCPSMMLTKVKPLCDDLGPWNTVAITNWEEKEKEIRITLSGKMLESLNSDKYIITEFFSRKTLGVFSGNDLIDAGTLLPHASLLLRIAPWNGESPVLTGTDLHFSGGGVEIKEWNVHNNSIWGEIETEWNYPVTINVAFPADNDNGYLLKTTTVQPRQNSFFITKM